jgi:hypothetical protein
VRALVEMAIENAVEGCVRETFGALVATYQAETAADPNLRAAMGKIAADETTHAGLAWRVAAWIDQRLTAAERARVAEARREAIEALQREAAVASLSREVRRFTGFPDPATAETLVARMRGALWAA